MGVVFIEGKVKGPAGEESVRFLVDSGATYTVLPEEVWRKIGLTPLREHEFVLADGRTVKRKVSECYISLPQGEGHTPVVLGEADDQALLGTVTLEILGLVLNPFKRTLEPMRMFLA
ncbi:aspartyl protease family protein [Infirmifilum lucidum]|uniref:Aspartyl protease family protein n=1 Tax=Infirmifilum lucidum TaxID=2776706 RepID=A0A7L9FK08_9CREN|nr:aspartyl protease family protein [Infirmifilum lucidum]QOJ79216.1 aspartyl protease family protein [Infirmifilum lucidum]